MPSKFIIGSQVAVADGEQARQGITTIQRSTGLDVTLWDTRPNTQSAITFNLTRIPSWRGIVSTTVLLLPEIRNERVRVVLNKDSEPLSSGIAATHERRNEQLPLIVSRQVNSIKYNIRNGKARRQHNSMLTDGGRTTNTNSGQLRQDGR